MLALCLQMFESSSRYNISPVLICFLLVYVLATSIVTSGRVLTCDSAYSWQLYSAGTLGNQAVSTMTTQSHYPDTDPNNPCTILIMPSSWLGSDKYQLHISHWFDSTMGSNPRSPICETSALPIQPPRLVSPDTTLDVAGRNLLFSSSP